MYATPPEKSIQLLGSTGANRLFDDLILELALASASTYTVAHNREDFRDAGRCGVGVLTPGRFLRIL
jgi:hypothetical protein